MKTSLFTSLAGVASALLIASCANPTPTDAMHHFDKATTIRVYGSNGQGAVQHRRFIDAGLIPANARLAIKDYISGSKWQACSYINPIYFLELNGAVWAICADPYGQMTGVLPVGKGNDARGFERIGAYHLLVNKTRKGISLGTAVMKDLDYADTLRQQVRKTLGLDEAPKMPPPPAPVKRTTSATPANTISSPTLPTAPSTPVAAPKPAPTETPSAAPEPAPAAEEDNPFA